MTFEPAFKLLNCRSVVRSPQVGERCWTCDIYPYELDGIGNREEVTVLKNEAGSQVITVQTKERRQVDLLKINVDAGMMYWVDGEWMMECEPLILDALEIQLRELPATIHPAMRDNLGEILEEIRWRLTRWGRVV